METRTEAPEVVGSLATLSGFYADNSPAARRRLRSTIENQGVAVNQDFLAAAQSVLQVGAGGEAEGKVGGRHCRCASRELSAAAQGGLHAEGPLLLLNRRATDSATIPHLLASQLLRRRWTQCKEIWMPCPPAAKP